LVAVTVLNILVAVSLPLWSQAIKRDKERELISRGLQYAEGIRVFQQRFGRLPVRLEELVEVQPRCIRRLWKDPMTEDGKWVPVFAGGEGTPPLPETPDGRPQQPGRLGGDPTRPEGKEGDSLDPNAPPQAGDQVAVGPIIGVHSKSTKDSVMTFLSQTRYDRWVFRADVFSLRPNPLGNPNLAPSFDPNWWRPFRGGIVPPGLQLPPPGAPPPPGTPGAPPPPNANKRRPSEPN
jgi:type II secretory pathway pseudopilin PulG